MEKKIVFRIFDQFLKLSFDSNLITVVLGPRQTGKTTSINLLLKDIPANQKLSLNFDSSFVREKIETEDYLQEKIESILFSSLDNFSGKFFLFIDEAQKCPSSFEQIKILYDKYSPKLKIIMSGSSVLEMMDKTAESLAGRIQTFHIYPFSIAEIGMFSGIDDLENSKEFFQQLFSGGLSLEFINEIIKYKKPKSEKISSLIEQLLTRSLFPPTYTKINEEMVEQWLSDYIDTYLERDMRTVSEIGNIQGYRNLIRQLASRTGNLLVTKSVALDSGVNHLTAAKYINLWMESLIGILLQPFFINPSTRIKKSKKVYFCDNGLSWALTGFENTSILRAGGKIGNLFENLIITEFMKYGCIFPKRPQFYFWEKSEVSEVDLIIQSQGLTIPVEIKWADKWNNKMLRGINTFKEHHQGKGLTIPYSLIIYNGEFLQPQQDVFCIPVWLLG